jgi:hypothetical protein
LTESAAQTTEPDCPHQEEFQALGGTEQGKGGGINRFTECGSIISFLGSCVRGLRINTAQREKKTMQRIFKSKRK